MSAPPSSPDGQMFAQASFQFYLGVSIRKVWRDLWNSKGRTLLVVFSIAVGVMAVGMITASNQMISERLMQAHQASSPSHAILFLRGRVAPSMIDSIARLPEVAAADGFFEGGIRWKAERNGEWADANLYTLEDYEAQQFDQIELLEGSWPDGLGVVVETNHITPYDVPSIGETIYFDVNDREKAATVVGVVRDPFQFPPPFSVSPAFYVNRLTMERLTGNADYNRIRFTLVDYSEEQAEVIADLIDERVQTTGVSVVYREILHPERHLLQDIMDGVGMVLQVMAILSLFLSVFLVVNTMNALVSQQMAQIGMMKIVGGISRQIMALYLAGVAVYGLLSLAVAVPLGALGGYGLMRWLLTLFNVPILYFELVSSALTFQIFAGLLVPLLAALWPVTQGVYISVNRALSSYGVGSGMYGRRLLDRTLSRLRLFSRMQALSLRNTFRRTGRVILTQLTLVAAGATFMMVLSAHYSFDRTINQIFAGFGYDVLVGFDSPQRVQEIEPMITAQPNVAGVEMWVFTNGQASQPGASGPASKHQVFVRGVPTSSAFFAPELVAGRDLLPDDGHALLLNQKIASKMGVEVGDTITIDFIPNGETEWTVVGLVFDLSGTDQNTAYVYRDVLNTDLGQIGRSSVAEVQLVDNSLEAQQAFEEDIRVALEALGVGVGFTNGAAEEQENISAQIGILIIVLLIMAVLMAAVGAMGLSGILSINVLERRREIGVMRAVGASSLDVSRIFIGEGILLGLLSWALSVPLSFAGASAFVEVLGMTIDFPAVYQYSYNGMWLWAGIAAILSLVASGLPAWRATHISVRESLSYE